MSAPTALELQGYLGPLTAKDLLPASNGAGAFRLAEVTSNELLWQAAKRMVQSRVSSVAVRGADKAYVGWLDVCDLSTVVFLLKLANAWAEVLGDQPPTWKQFAETERKVLQSQVVSELSNVSMRDHWHEVAVNAPVKTVLQDLVTRAREIRRVAVRDTSGAVVGVVSPFDAIRFVHSAFVIRRQLFQGVLFAALFNDVNAKPTTAVISVLDTDKVIDAFTIITEKMVSGVAVVDAQGVLVSVLSATDIMRTRRDGSDSINDADNWVSLFDDLNITVQEYLTRRNRFFPGGYSNTPIVFKRNVDTVADVLQKVVGAHIHRLFEVDAAGKPSAVWALTDLLRVFTEYTGVHSAPKADKKPKAGKKPKAAKKAKGAKKGKGKSKGQK